MDNVNGKNKVFGKIVIGIFIGILLSVGAFAALYVTNVVNFTSSDVENKEAKNENKEDADNDYLIEDEDITTPDSYDFNFNPSKIVNTSADNYTLTVPSHALGTNVSLDSSQMKVTVSFNYYLVNTNYNLGWVTSLDSTTYEMRDINFTKKVVDIFFGGIGQDASGDTILFLMEDGTVEYLPLKKAYATNNESLNSYGSLPGISNIVKFYSANANSQMGSGITILAQDNEGNLYDLSTTLRETGNY